MQNVEVLNVGSNFVPDPRRPSAAGTPTGPVTTITFPLTREEAVLLKFLKDDGAQLDLLLRPIGDEKNFETPNLDARGALERLKR